MESKPPINPYASPATDAAAFEAKAVVSDAEAIRREHIKHEAAVKSIGWLYLLGAVITIPTGVLMLVLALAAVVEGTHAEDAAINAPVGVFYLGLGALSAALFRGFRRLRPWVRIPATVLSVLGLLSVPIGTIINSYILYLLHSKKGRMVFSWPYQEVMAQTPHMRYRSSPVLMVALVVLVLIFVTVTVAVLLG